MDVIAMEAGPARVELYPGAGGRIGQITVDGQPMLRGPEIGATELGWGHWGSYPLLPWSNRIPDGTIRFEGRTMSVPVNWEDGTALHGLAVDAPWITVAADATSAALTIDIDTGPYAVRGEQTFRLSPTHLDMRLGVINNAAQRIPVGLGIHPWFSVAEVRVPAELAWPGDTPLPAGPARPVTADEDLRVRRTAPLMDRCYTGLTGTTAEIGGLQLSWSGPITQVVVFTGVPGWICVEPVTMANDGFRLADEGIAGHGVIALGPAERIEVSYRFAWADD